MTESRHGEERPAEPAEGQPRGPFHLSGLLRLVIASDGELAGASLGLLDSVDAFISRSTNRRYTARVPSIPGMVVNFQRHSNIPMILDDGKADIGIVGLDRYLESRQEDGSVHVLVDDLGFGHSRLVVAVQNSWRAIRHIHHLADRAGERTVGGQPIRIATKYPRLVRRFLQTHGVTYFELVPVDGTLEAAPRLGLADAVADISDTGNTLRENGLRPLVDGTVIQSKAVMVGNVATIAADARKLQTAKLFLERIDARSGAGSYCRVTAIVQGTSEEAVANSVLRAPELAASAGPTVSKVWTPDPGSWFSVQVDVRRRDIQRIVDHLREIGGKDAVVSELGYIYRPESELYSRLLNRIDALRAAGEI